MQEQFAELIDQYYKHNEKALQGYRSTSEILDELTARLKEEMTSTRRFPIMKEGEKISWQLGKVKNRKGVLNRQGLRRFFVQCKRQRLTG